MVQDNPKEKKQGKKERMVKESDVRKAIESMVFCIDARLEFLDRFLREFSELLSNESLHMLGAYKKALQEAKKIISGE